MSASSLTETNDTFKSSEKKQLSFSRSILFAIAFWLIVGVFMYGMMRLRNVFCLVFAILVFFSGMQTVFAENDFEIHFLDVGQGDAAIILCNGESLMIDGGAPSCSSLIYSYLVNDLGLTHIDYMISTHPHDDHVGGLSAALNACTVGKIYSPVTTYESKPFSSLTKYANAQNIEITVPILGESFQLY